MSKVRVATRDYANALQEIIPEGPDKTYLLRKVREIGMWANVAITRNADGSPRLENTEPQGKTQTILPIANGDGTTSGRTIRRVTYE